MTISTKMTGSGGDTLAYEALRTHILTGVSPGSNGGLIVLLRQGLAAWMARRPVSALPIPSTTSTAVPFLGSELHTAIVRVLASVALSGRAEGYA